MFTFATEQLDLVSFERKKFKLIYARDEDCQWLLDTLQTICFF